MKAIDKIWSLENLVSQVKNWQQAGQKVVFTNGCFDIIHLGHVDYLEKAKAMGDRLVVAANSDSSVEAIKGPNRPVSDEKSRTRVLASLQSVDAVFIFSDQTPLAVIKALNPNVLVKGNDYLADCSDPNDHRYIVGSDIVRENGGEVYTVELVEGYSTSRIIDKIVGLK